MKKLLILIVLLATCSNIFALLTQANWRWRNDDGTETAATWKAAQNTQAVLSTKGEIWRLRLELYNNTGGSYPFYDTLQYATSTSGPWTNIGVTAGSNAFKIAGVSAVVTQADPTTAQLAGTAYTFSPGKIMVDSMEAENLDLADQNRTEIEWAIKSTSNIIPNTIYYFREQWGDGGAFMMDGGATYPSLVTAGVLAVKFTGFSVIREGEKAKLEWSTASEQNINKFEVLRSGNGRTWKTVTTINGQGSTSVSGSFTAFDNTPLSGVNYYVIKQYDKDGSFYQSEIKLLKMPGLKSVVSVSPNPSRTGISFRIANSSASNVEAQLISMNGNVIYREIINNVQPNSANKLSMRQQPGPGMYILKLKGEGLSESVKVVIE
jgi:uncharacterized protein (UPF0333 family)